MDKLFYVYTYVNIIDKTISSYWYIRFVVLLERTGFESVYYNDIFLNVTSCTWLNKKKTIKIATTQRIENKTYLICINVQNYLK